ncbi:hypothetical protein FDENT_10734 [Fusarium denticulatum]|uniref:Uncharacterized protein n=1 Tax=Fusarium denticulatum TaxID=48507 RepID=A0A8H5TKN4_9HYPO|nr:hypothetical protein FDENT_10734 [Fusarium denticulatum]
MATRELLIVILNHTNEELVADPEWPALNHGEWTKTPELQPPQTILASESGMLRCKSSHIGGGVDGSITYRIVGIRREERGHVHVERPILGGRGKEAVDVIVFGPAKMANIGPGDGVWAAVTRYSVECAKSHNATKNMEKPCNECKRKGCPPRGATRRVGIHRPDRKTQEHGLERRTETDGVYNAETRDDDGVDDASVDMRFRNACEVAEAAENAQDDDGGGEF